MCVQFTFVTDGRENSLLGRMCFSISLTARHAHHYADIQCCDWVWIVSITSCYRMRSRGRVFGLSTTFWAVCLFRAFLSAHYIH